MKTKSTFHSAPARRSFARKPVGEGGFFNLRASVAMIVFFAGLFLALFATSAPPPGPVTQAWVARYNGPANLDDGGHAIAGDSSGNVYVTGGSHGLGTDLDYATIKYDSAGQQQWVARYNGPGNGWDRAAAIARDSSANVYVTGQSLGLGTNFDYATVKYDSAGQEQWAARYNGPGNGEDDAVAIATDGSGNVYVTGQSLDSGTGFDYATIKYDSAGQEQWVARYNGPPNGSDTAKGVAVDTSGNVYVTGRSLGSGGYFDYATVKYDSAGQEQWVARYNGPGNGHDDAEAIAVDSSGNVYVTGGSAGSDGLADYATVKYNSAGQEQWVARYNGPRAWAIALDGSGNVYVTGESEGDRHTVVDYATIKYSSGGEEQWVARYNGSGSGYDRAEAIAVDGSGNVYVTGQSVGSRHTGFDYATVKYDAAGQQQWAARYTGPGNSGEGEEAQGIVVDGSGNVYVTGASLGSGTGYDYATIKYVQNPTPTPRPRP
jgi:beta-propeller repeat-containing protein